MIITIDGPVASGKSCVARAIAQKLGVIHFNTGLLYRAVAYIFTQLQGHELSGNIEISEKTYDLSFIKDLSYKNIGGSSQVLYENQDITSFLSDEVLSAQASIISSFPVIREALMDVQRRFALTQDVVADGRDCGSVIFPDAQVKIYLTADVAVRAQRVYNDVDRKVNKLSLDEITRKIIDRDERDKSRTVAPLVVPQDAVIIDSSHLSCEQTLEKCLEVIRVKSHEKSKLHTSS